MGIEKKDLDIGNGLVVGVEKKYYVVKDVDTKEIIHITQDNFDYEMNRQILNDIEKDELLWMIHFNRQTKQYVEVE